MGKHQVAAMAEAYGRQIPEPGVAPAKPQRSGRPKKDLDDPATQEKIFNPDTHTIKFIDGYTLTLNEPSLTDRKGTFGFCTRVLADAASLPGVNRGLLPVRIMSLLNGRRDLEREMHFWAAKLAGAAGSVTDEQAVEIAKEIESHAWPKDLGPEFNALCVLAGADFPN